MISEDELTLLRDKAARAQGWINFPNDSVELGSKWHTEAVKAPFGYSFYKSHWKPESDYEAALILATSLKIMIDPRSHTVVCAAWDGMQHAWHCTEYYREHENFPGRATCLAVLRCAAAIYDWQLALLASADRGNQ